MRSAVESILLVDRLGICLTVPVEQVHNARKGFLWICIAHVVEGTDGGNAYPNARWLPYPEDGLDHFAEKAHPVRSTAAVGIGADV